MLAIIINHCYAINNKTASIIRSCSEKINTVLRNINVSDALKIKIVFLCARGQSKVADFPGKLRVDKSFRQRCVIEVCPNSSAVIVSQTCYVGCPDDLIGRLGYMSSKINSPDCNGINRINLEACNGIR